MTWIFRSSLLIVISLPIALISVPAFAQGCSDAGFCTIGTLHPQQEDSTKRGQKISLLFPLGIGDERVFVLTPALQYSNQFSERWGMQAKLTVNYADGNLGGAFGLGDLFLSSTYATKANSEWSASFTVGTKIPLNSGNLQAAGRSLPMQYQSSLGTMDLITGISISNHSWKFSAGWQQPVSGANRNNFLPAVWQGHPAADKYPASNNFNRKGDVLLRAAYTISVKKFSITPGLLAIYHLNEDTYVDPNISSNPISIVGSQGLTLNCTLAGTWTLSNRLTITFSAGMPVIFRDVRPDGLTRKFVFTPEIHWKF